MNPRDDVEESEEDAKKRLLHKASAIVFCNTCRMVQLLSEMLRVFQVGAIFHRFLIVDRERPAALAPLAGPARRGPRQVPQQPHLRAGVHGRGLARPGHPAGGLGGELRPPQRPLRLHPSRGTHGASRQGGDRRVVRDAAERGEAAGDRGGDGEAVQGVRGRGGGERAEDSEPRGQVAARGQAVYGGERTGSQDRGETEEEEGAQRERGNRGSRGNRGEKGEKGEKG